MAYPFQLHSVTTTATSPQSRQRRWSLACFHQHPAGPPGTPGRTGGDAIVVKAKAARLAKGVERMLLSVPPLDSDAERDQLLELCRERLDAFRDHADQRFDQVPGAHPRHGPLRVLRRSRAPKGPGGGPHHPQKPGRLRRHQQPAGALLPLQCRPQIPHAWVHNRTSTC